MGSRAATADEAFRAQALGQGNVQTGGAQATTRPGVNTG
jgi:hypothetical protein